MIIMAFAALYVLWGSTYLAMRVAVHQGVTPFLGAGLRMLVAGGLMWGYMIAKGEPQPSPRQWPDLAIAGGLLFVGGNGLVMVANQTLASGLVAILVATMPFWLAGMEAMIPGGERLSRLGTAGIVLGFVGVVILVAPDFSTKVTSWGLIVALVSPIFWSMGSLWAKHRLRGMSVVAVSAHEMLWGSLLLLITGLLLREQGGFAPTRAGLEAMTYLVFVGSLAGFGSFNFLLKHVAAAKVATYAYVNPVVAVLLGWLVLSEPLSWRLLAGALVVLLGVVLVNFAKARN